MMLSLTLTLLLGVAAALDLVIEPFEAAASMTAVHGTAVTWDAYGANSSLVLSDSGTALQVNYTVEQAQSWGGAVVFNRGAQSQANFECASASSISLQVRVLEASPGVDAVIAKGVGKPLPVQLQQLLNTHLGSAALS